MKTAILLLQLHNFADVPQTVKEMTIREHQQKQCLEDKTCKSVWNEQAQAYEIVPIEKEGSNGK
jgi:hypothetical protein